MTNLDNHAADCGFIPNKMYGLNYNQIFIIGLRQSLSRVFEPRQDPKGKEIPYRLPVVSEQCIASRRWPRKLNLYSRKTEEDACFDG